MQPQVKEPPVVRCPGCNQPMEPQERARVTDRLVDIRYVCAVCGMETKRTVKEDEKAAVLGNTHWRMQARLPLKHV
jgi:RNase P subunit RPR2